MVDLGATHSRTQAARATTPRRRSDRPEHVTLLVLAALAILACVLFLTLGARGNWSFVLPFRGAKLVAMLFVAHAIATSTVVFQTIAGNRILTPSIMGFDALYRLIQTLLVFLTGAATTAAIAPAALFAGELLVMVLFACGLYGTLIGAGTRDIHRLSPGRRRSGHPVPLHRGSHAEADRPERLRRPAGPALRQASTPSRPAFWASPPC